MSDTPYLPFCYTCDEAPQIGAALSLRRLVYHPTRIPELDSFSQMDEVDIHKEMDVTMDGDMGTQTLALKMGPLHCEVQELQTVILSKFKEWVAQALTSTVATKAITSASWR